MYRCKVESENLRLAFVFNASYACMHKSVIDIHACMHKKRARP